MSEQNRKYLGIALAAGAVFALGLGLRQAQPLFISSLNSHTGIGYATISFAFGVAQLMWGVAQPVAGAVADRWGPRWVMIAGAVLLGVANAATPFSGNAVVLTLLIGVAAAAGAGTIGPAMLISAANRWIPEGRRSVATGIINAGGSFGQFTIIPLAQLLIGIAGWQPAMVMGSLWIGKAVQRRRMKYALAVIYFARAMLILAFFFAPKTPAAFFLFAAGIGFTYLSTVPPTVGLVAKLLGARYLATLFGIVMLSHQVGGFLGAWLGGKAFEATRSYDWMWLADITLCLFAAVVHLPIREASVVPAAVSTRGRGAHASA